MRCYDKKIPLFSIHIPKAAGTSLTCVLEQWFNNGFSFNIDNHPRLYRLFRVTNLDFYFQRLKGGAFWRHYKNHQFNMLPRTAPLGKGYGTLLNVQLPECVHGHFDPLTDKGNLFDYYPQAKQFITFLRDPLHLQISLYEYNAAQGKKGGLYWQGKKVMENQPFEMTLEDYITESKSYILHFFPWTITEKNYKAIIEENFVFVGIVERMDESLTILSECLGVEKQTAPRKNRTHYESELSDDAINKFKRRHKLEYAIYNYANMLLDKNSHPINNR